MPMFTTDVNLGRYAKFMIQHGCLSTVTIEISRHLLIRQLRCVWRVKAGSGIQEKGCSLDLWYLRSGNGLECVPHNDVGYVKLLHCTLETVVIS